jgi:SAM-dependent methyltransferase
MNEDMPFDRRLRRLRRDRAAAKPDAAGYLHLLVADELAERLDLVSRDFGRALLLGCAGGYLANRLVDRGIDLTCADPGFDFAREAGGVECDEDRLPFRDGSFDLVIAAGTLDTVNDLPGALLLIRRLLRPDGLFLGVFAGAGSLPRLRSAMLAADEAGDGAAPHIHPQIDVRTAGDLLARAGFALPVADGHGYDIRFSELADLVAELRAAAATNMLTARSRRPLGRRAAAAATAHFAAEADPDGKTTERFELVHMLGWAPSPDQPKPAARGSGGASLAEALRRPGSSS